MTNFFTNLNKNIRTIILKIIIVLIILASTLPIHVEGISAFIPAFDLIIIFYWSVYKPKLLGPIFIMSLSLLEDIIYGMPLGITSLLNVIAQYIITSQRRYFLKEPFGFIWFGFGVFCLGMILMKWAVIGILHKKLYFANYIIMQWLLSVAIYPMMHSFFSKIYQSLFSNRKNA